MLHIACASLLRDAPHALHPSLPGELGKPVASPEWEWPPFLGKPTARRHEWRRLPVLSGAPGLGFCFARPFVHFYNSHTP